MTTLPFHFASRYGAFVIPSDTGRLRLVAKESIPYKALIEIRRILQENFEVEYVPEQDFQSRFTEYYENPQQVSSIADIIVDSDDWGSALKQTQAVDLMEQEGEGPAVRLVNALLIDAIRHRASDIHLETYERQMSIRMRMDGELKEVAAPDATLAPMLISRIKVMARLDIAEKRLPQDGRISLRLAGRDIDLRVSTIPVSEGERVVLRLLDKQASQLNIENVGLREPQLDLMSHLIRRPHGMILVTGPTGSGKTTTLYAMLSALNTKKRNILTIEDPVEYRLQGIGQTQVNAKTGLTFASGLRALLRQDPDIIMVGEIRDTETAQIAVHAALTGHLVFSTLHTNTAISAVTRLRDMGVESFLLASCLAGLHAQRLVRRLCIHCSEERGLSSREARFLHSYGFELESAWYPVGCEHCKQQGYQGRMAVHELYAVDQSLQSMIHNEAPEHELEAVACQHQRSLTANGCDLVAQGITSIEEVVRVTET